MALVLVLAIAAPAVCGDAPITIAITDHSQLIGLEQAKEYAERVFSAVGVEVVWVERGGCEGLNLSVTLLASTGKGVLGRASVDLRQAWLYMDRISLLAAKNLLDARVLLGRVIVHEVAHLLLIGHGPDGVMTERVYTGAMEGKFTFTPKEVADMRAEIGRRAGACRR